MALGRNVDISVHGGKLAVKVDLTQEGVPSSTGKTLIIASTSGNVVVDPSSGAKLGLNVYVPNPEYKG